MNNLSMWKNDFFENSADIIIYFNGIKYKLNKQVLFVSTTLKNLLQGGYEESFKDEINLDIEEISVDSWELLLNYIYGEHVRFYKQIFNITITNTSFDLSQLESQDILNLYVASDYFDVASLTDKLMHNLSSILDNLIYSNNIDSITTLIEYMPSIVNVIISKLDKSSYEHIIEWMSLCADNKDYFCNNIVFETLANKFKIPDNVNNLYELTEYLKEKKIILSNSLSNLYKFEDIESENILLNYFILKYPNLNINQIRNIIQNIIGNFTQKGASLRLAKSSTRIRTKQEIEEFELNQRLKSIDPRRLITKGLVKSAIFNDR